MHGATALYKDATPAVQQGRSRTPSRLAQMHSSILVVDDEEMVRRVATRMLSLHGFAVIEAANGVEALEVLARDAGRVGLVLTDVAMPVLDGCALGEAIAREWPHLPVIYMSGYSEDERLVAGVVATDVPFLAKPFTADALLRRVRLLAGPNDSD